MEDEKIIELFFARSEEAIRQTDIVYGKRLLNLSKNIAKNEQDAQECVNDTYLRTWDTIPPQKPKYFFAYIARLCRNLSLDKLDWNNAQKRHWSVVSLTEEMEMCIPDPVRDREMEAKELGKLLDAFLRTQSKENQMVFLRRYWFADTIAEIAARYGISESAVQMRLSRTKTRLCTYLEKEGIQV